MKKIVSILAAISVICGSLGAAMPVVAADTSVINMNADTNGYDLEGRYTTSEEDGVKYNVYSDFAVITSVSNENIEEFTVPDAFKDKPVVGLTSNPFEKCTSLKKINLSKNVAVFDWPYIAEEGIAEVTVPEDNKYFTAVDGVIYTKDMKELVCCPTACGKTELTIPDETVSIRTGAFACCRDLKKVTMGDALENIYPSAFWGCSGLTEAELSKNLRAIGYWAFAGCSSLKSIDLPDSLEELYDEAFRDTACGETEDGITYVDGWAVSSDKDIVNGFVRHGTVGTASGLFNSRYKLKSISIPTSVKHITNCLMVALGRYVLLDHVDFHNDFIPEKCIVGTCVKEYNIFNPDCKIADVTSALMPYYVDLDPEYVYKEEEEKPIEYTLKHSTKIVSSSSGSSSIQKSASAQLIDLDTNEPVEIKTTSSDDSQTTSTSYDIEAEITIIHEKSAPEKLSAAPKYDTVIRAVEGSTAEEYALKYRRVFDAFEPVMTTVGPEIVNDTVNGIDYWIYNESYAVARLNSNRQPNVKASREEVTIPAKINGVPVKVFRVFNGDYDTVHLPATIEEFRSSSDLADDNTAYYDIDKDNPYLTSVDGIIYSKDMTRLIKAPSRYEGKKIEVPDGVKVIDSFAMFYLRNVESIVLPDSVEIIRERGISFGKKLASVRLSDNLDTIGDGAFMSCNELEDISIPDSVKHIGFAAFSECPAVKYDNGLGYLSDWLVDVVRDGRITQIVPKSGTVGIARIGFHTSVVIPESVTKMSWEMTDIRCSSGLKRADVYSHVLEYDAFKNARHLKDIYIYDPECEIRKGSQTINAKHIEVIGNESAPPDYIMTITRTPVNELEAGEEEKLADTVIHGYSGSTAEAYAKMYGIKFEEIDKSTVYKNGDINGDGGLNVGDIILVSRYLHGTYSLTQEQSKSADLNGDGSVDVFDLIEFRKSILRSLEEN